MTPAISVTIITLNEEKNLPRAIRSVAWAQEVLVVDSGSTDRTVEIAKSLGARVLLNPWPGYGQQKNFAQKNAAHDWVLNIDADEEVPPALAEKLRASVVSIDATQGPWGFCFPRKTFYMGRWIRHGGWYPNYLVRFAHRGHAVWTEPNVHEQLQVDGQVNGQASGTTRLIAEPLLHFTFSSIQEQVLANLRYARLGARRLEEKGQSPSFLKMIAKPIGKFIETFLIKRGFLDGLPGFIISVNAAHSMFLKYAYLHEDRLARKTIP